MCHDVDMPKICYQEIDFSPKRKLLIDSANAIIEDYTRRGFDLTLRQLYYQFVARNVIPNTEASYKSLGDLIGDARMAGKIDWHAIVDRTRSVRGNQHWEKPSDVVRAAAASFALDKWAEQDHYVEVWVEKDALRGIVGQVCGRLDVRYFSCRGYVSLSEVWVASQRLRERAKAGKKLVILHLGDHDPSGIDMTRDIRDRLRTFKCPATVERIALNMDQIRQHNFPPNYAKITDSRYAAYQEQYGDSSWELDAVDPQLLSDLIARGIRRYLHQPTFDAAVARENMAKKGLLAIAEKYVSVLTGLKEGKI